MIRRTFFQSLAAALLPRPLLAATKPVQPTCEPFARTLPHPVTIPDPDWLREWREIPKLEIFAKDLPDHEDPHQRELGYVILRHIGEGSPFTFRYIGGSEPGAVRTVLPTLLYRLDYFAHFQFRSDDPMEDPESYESPIYLLGWCQTRQAARTFRLDRVETARWLATPITPSCSEGLPRTLL